MGQMMPDYADERHQISMGLMSAIGTKQTFQPMGFYVRYWG
jgi:hypothetical protein